LLGPKNYETNWTANVSIPSHTHSILDANLCMMDPFALIDLASQ
jgi:hypothetical protein